ncbi:hypothetical protein RA28_19645 [Ruegeria sp. ANG-S4]|uniref:hypothetical protein n=1 Tax=Ruegeria sp. ANG-S4 TaxID=1577904 RepID=UPI00057F61E9|nr:hypothetical protein [Ruegeria sp. ANG-S4]KIC43841.1 hypothetical protein RA28_19645 [Ruegeria sp. ANG-S4]
MAATHKDLGVKNAQGTTPTIWVITNRFELPADIAADAEAIGSSREATEYVKELALQELKNASTAAKFKTQRSQASAAKSRKASADRAKSKMRRAWE